MPALVRPSSERFLVFFLCSLQMLQILTRTRDVNQIHTDMRARARIREVTLRLTGRRNLYSHRERCLAGETARI